MTNTNSQAWTTIGQVWPVRGGSAYCIVIGNKNAFKTITLRPDDRMVIQNYIAKIKPNATNNQTCEGAITLEPGDQIILQAESL